MNTAADLPWLTTHALDRADGRIAANGIPVAPLLRRAVAYGALNRHRDIAVRLLRLDAPVGDLDSPLMVRGSNGTDLWAVVRSGEVTTLMWRRPEQPIDLAAFNVDAVFMAGWKDPVPAKKGKGKR